MKILFTSVGRRVELIQAFRLAAQKLNVDLIIIGADISDTAPALFFCDEKKIVPCINNPEYIPQLLNICDTEQVDCLIPTIDTDLLLLAENKSKFESIGTKVLVSAADKVRICRDKRYTANYFHSLGLKSPMSFDSTEKYEYAYPGDSGFPAFIKPKDGSSSIDAYKVTNADDLQTYAHKIKDYIIQPFISGREYTIDIFCDYEGNPVYITPRERLAVRAGEVLKTQICQDRQMISEMKTLIADYRPCGQITVQLIREEESGDDYYIEINPRFGGGAPLSIKAGADSAEAVIRVLKGDKLSYKEDAAVDGAVYCRFDQSICVSEGSNNEMTEITDILDVENYIGDLDAIIFDLDDTLYSEKEYVRSGYRKIAELFPEIKGAEELLWKFFQEKKSALDEFLKCEDIFTEANKAKCLEVYRFHKPDIHLYSGVREMLKRLKRNYKLGMITDGRPEGQRAKIKALGLEEIFDQIIITDELGGTEYRKPNETAYRMMAKKFGTEFGAMCYVGDNTKKDFIAPMKLGMKSIWFRNEDGLYQCSEKRRGVV